MAEYWKSTPKYWCKHCSVYVRDTKLERANHEATGRHRGAVERALRDLHRGHEREEREKERARREIDRLNGVVSGSGGSGPATTARRTTPVTAQAPGPALSKEQRQAQLEQLSGLGVSIPDELRGEMAMAGEWTVTKTRVVEEVGEKGRTKGVRKRELEKTEEEKEEDKAVDGLFKKPRRWGRDSKVVMEDDGGELDALLSGDFEVKREEAEEAVERKAMQFTLGGEKTEEGVKLESGDEEVGVAGEETPVKKEPEEDGGAFAALPIGDTEVKAEAPAAPEEAAAPAVVFKKRKPKNIRQK